MNNQLPRLKYEVSEQIIDTKSLLDEENFYHQKQGAPSELTKKLTFILGDYKKSYPISLMTVGGIGYGGDALQRAAVELDDTQFTYPVMGRLSKASVVVKTDYTGGDKPGIGNGEFYLYFADNLIKRFFIIQSARGVQAYVRKDAENVGGFWKYTCVLDPALASDFCPISEVTEGAAWIAVNTAVAESRSRSTESTMAMPGSYKNQMGFLRAGMSWAGNAANKIMRIKATDHTGQTTDVWMDYFMWQFENEWLSQCEHVYWYSRYNRLADGTVPLKDLLTGKIIPRGSGILEQVQNKTTYSSLSYNFIQNLIGDALYSQQDQQGKSITFHGGRGFLREFDRAMKDKGIQMLQDWGMVADKFVTGSGYNLMMGGFFDGFYHIDGYTIKVKHNPIFDFGKIAMTQVAGGYVHPETGWALESYRGVFIDDSDYDGQPNIQHVAQKGRAFLHGVIPGLTPMPKSIQNMTNSFNVGGGTAEIISSDVDESSYTRFKSAGIQILRANTCFDVQCVAGL
jgi:hypothetical protein